MGRHLKSTLMTSFACLALGTMATGCASTATGISQSSVMKLSSSQNLKVSAPKGTPLAVIRYPAYVESSAEDAYYRAFGKTTIGGNLGSKRPDAAEVNALADSIILKSNYFALSMFKELAAKLPEHGVLLSPHTIKLDASGKLTSEPMTQAESLPNVVTVDFASYTYPDSSKMMGKEPLTFGDLITPLVVVRTDHRAAVPTQGLLLASRPLMARAAGNARKSVNENIDVIQRGRMEPSIPELDFVSHLKGGQVFQVASTSLGSRGNNNAAKSLPLEKIRLEKSIIANIDQATDASADPLKNAFSKGFANQVVALINDTDIEKATMAGRAAAISQFDESLAALTFVGSDDADYQTRLRYAERLLEAEQKYLSVQSLRLFDGVHNSEMGAQVRDMLKAEYNVLEKRRALAREQNKATAFAVLGAVAAGAAIAGGGSSSSCNNSRTQGELNDCLRRARNAQLGNQVLTNLAIQGAIVATQQAFAINRQSRAVTSNYLTSIVPALDEQTSVQVNLIDSNETITAIRFEDLKAKLQTLYSTNQRSLDTIATRCGYSHTGATKTGTWLGVCENGLANGSGVGVLKNADGSSVEYYGQALNGQPHGAGYMVHHNATSSYALEGNFTAGNADGVMRVSKSGSSDVLKTYQSGQDLGKAPSGSINASPFAPSVGIRKIAMVSP